jgi:hypothetical protein
MNIANDPIKDNFIEVSSLISLVSKISNAKSKYADAAIHAGTKINFALLINKEFSWIIG